MTGNNNQTGEKHYKGIVWRESEKRWIVKSQNYGWKEKRFKSPDDAWEYYKQLKSELIFNVVNEYKGVIPDYIYQYCISYKIEKNDYLL